MHLYIKSVRFRENTLPKTQSSPPALHSAGEPGAPGLAGTTWPRDNQMLYLVARAARARLRIWCTDVLFPCLASGFFDLHPWSASTYWNSAITMGPTGLDWQRCVRYRLSLLFSVSGIVPKKKNNIDIYMHKSILA